MLNSPPPPGSNPLVSLIAQVAHAARKANDAIKRRVERLEQLDYTNSALGHLAVAFASLPVAGTSTGLVYLCSNCRKGGEGPGVGTGLMVFTDGTGTWKNIYNNLAAAA